MTLIPYIAYGSDTDCDGTSHYACGVLARDLSDAFIQVEADFPGTAEGINKIMPYATALAEDPRLAGIMDRTYDNPEWVQGDSGPGRWVTETRPFRYAALGACWNPWVYDDSLGTPLDHTLDD